MFRLKKFGILLLFSLVIMDAGAQSNGNGYYSKLGFNGYTAGWHNMKAVVNDYGGTNANTSYNLAELNTQLGFTTALGYAFDNWNGTWIEAAHYTSRCSITMNEVRSQNDTDASTFSFVSRQFNVTYGINIYNEDLVRFGIYTGLAGNLIKMQTVDSYIPPSGQMLFRTVGVLSGGTLKKIGVVSYTSIPIGATFMLGEDWGLSVSGFWNIPLTSVSMIAFRNKVNPNNAALFPENAYSSRTGGLGFHIVAFIGE